MARMGAIIEFDWDCDISAWFAEIEIGIISMTPFDFMEEPERVISRDIFSWNMEEITEVIPYTSDSHNIYNSDYVPLFEEIEQYLADDNIQVIGVKFETTPNECEEET